jgi:hypothetical protein
MSDTNNLYTLLYSGKSIETICNEWGIKAKRHPVYSNLVLFCYDQYNVVPGSVSDQARGHILDESNGWSHVCRPFDRFFNLGESRASNVDLSTAKLFHKLDGSLANMWWYKGKWHMSTKGSPDGSGSTHSGSDVTFNDLFWNTFKLCGYVCPTDEWKDYTFVFELTTTKNVVVCHQKSDTLTLIAVRNNITGHEIELDDPILLNLSFNKCKAFYLSNPTKEMFAGISGYDLEGYIVTNFSDGLYKRVKLKNPAYVELHNSVLEFPTKRNMVARILRGEKEEYVVYFPHYKDFIEEVESEILSLINQIESEWNQVKHITERKTLAQKVFGGSFKMGTHIMNLYGKGVDARTYVSELGMEKVYQLLS